MEIVNKELQSYLDGQTQEESGLLKRINRETFAEVLSPNMLSGHYQGRVLSMISHMIRPQNILEIGTFTGYSALCLIEGLAENGKLYTIDINEELEERVRGYFEDAGFTNKVEYLIGNALEIIPSLDVVFDLVFIDADKGNYPLYFDYVLSKIRSGGFILADNVLWKGKVIHDGKVDKDTEKLLTFNDKVQQDGRVENIILPIRDGLSIIRKI